jgi:prepilin-type N-terminal cleavage/methylation domain-containing protein
VTIQNPKSKIQNSSLGFTLIELLVTIGLLSILLYMLASVFTAAHIAFTDTRRVVQAAQTGRVVIDAIRNDLVGARLVRTGLSPIKGGFFSGVDREESGVTPLPPPPLEYYVGYNTETAGHDTLAFVTETFQSARATGAPVPPVPQLVKVKYFLNRDGVMKRVSWDEDYAEFNKDGQDSADEPEAVGLNQPGVITVTRLDFRYCGYSEEATASGFTEYGNWNWDALSSDTYGLPAAVEVTVTIQWLDSRTRTRTMAFTELVYLPAYEWMGESNQG